MAPNKFTSHFFVDAHMDEPVSLDIGGGRLVVLVTSNHEHGGANQDAVAAIPLSDDHAVFVLADGFGGHPAGDQAAELSLKAMETCVRKDSDDGEDIRGAILTGFEIANEWVRGLGVGAATTLIAVEIKGGRARAYHVGDSAATVVGQRGKVKLRTVPHSPVGYAVESGLINEKEAMSHEDRHVVSNMVGSTDMSIEMSTRLKLNRRDTLLVASDGLFDNMVFDDIVERVRHGSLLESVASIASLCRRRMRNPSDNLPSKPDDLSIIAWRHS